MSGGAGGRARLPRWLRLALEPRVLIPTLLTAALLAFALSITDLPRVMAGITALPFSTLAAAFALAVAYLLFKGLELALLLRGLGFRTPWRSLLLAFAVGELTLTIPSGVYAQNYVLHRTQGDRFARSAAATSAMLVIEGAVIAAVLLVVSIPGWGWLRPAIAGASAATAVLFAALVRSRSVRAVVERAQHGRLGFLARGVIEMARGLRTLAVPRLLLPSVLLTVAYLAALVAAFLVVGRGVGESGFTYLQALTIYFFSLGVTMALGSFLTQLGVIEVVGLGAAQAWGYGLTAGLTMLLGFRLVWMGSIWLVCGLLAVLLHRELAARPGENAGAREHG